VVDDVGSELVRVSGAADLPDRIRVPSAFGWELLPEALAGLHASLERGFPQSRLIPLAIRDRVIGVLLTATEPVAPLDDLARQGAAALALADGLTDAVERRRRTRPLSPAAELQRALLPPPLLRVTGGEIAADVQASPAVGGDWYDVAENEDGAWIALADPPGRGVASVARGAVALAAYRAARRAGRDLIETVRATHEALAESQGEAIPAVIARWHAPSSTVAWVRCGPAHGFVAGANGTLTALEGPEHPALGEGATELEVQPRLVRLGQGDRLLLVSDGVMNRRAPGGARFGAEGLQAAVVAADPATAGGTVIAIRRALAAASRKLLADDATVVVLASG
jgi:serine phosphatase RsbU (regulator of sigma subunit)